MAIAILGPLNGVINQTVGQVLSGNLLTDAAGVLNKFVTSSFDAAGSVLQSVADLTKPEPPAAQQAPPSAPPGP